MGDARAILPFECNYCGKIFCAKHRIPEIHECLNLPKEAPWHLREKGGEEEQDKNGKFSSEGDFHFEKRKDWEEKQRQNTKKRKIFLPLLALSAVAVISARERDNKIFNIQMVQSMS
jgi:hypothetical protein